MEHVKTRELLVAARVAEALVYAAGIAGVVAGGLLFRGGDEAFAVVAWLLTFVAGAALRLAAWAARALAELLERIRSMENDLARMAAQPRENRSEPRGPDQAPDSPPDPYRRWGGWH